MSRQPNHAIRCLKRDVAGGVWLIERPGESPRTLKRWVVGWSMPLKLLFGIAQPQRQVRGTRRLERAGVPTPGCLDRWRFRRVAGRPVIDLELEFAPGRPAWEILAALRSGDAPDEHLLLGGAASLGRLVAQLTEARLFHRDIKLANVIVDEHEGSPRLWVIDTVGVRRMRHLVAEVERMIERCALQPLHMNAALARRVRIRMLLNALRPLAADQRRAVLQRLRRRPPPRSD